MVEASKEGQVERWWAFRQSAIEHSKDYGIATVRSLILINGAAIIATLTFISRLQERSQIEVGIEQIKVALACYVFGLLFSLVTGALGYLNFQYNALSIPDPDRLESVIESGEFKGRQSKSINRTAIAAFMSAVFSFVAFAGGSLFALFAIGVK